MYQELSYVRRDTQSPRQLNDSEAYLNEQLLRLIDKYRKFGLTSESFEVLKGFCEGLGLDFSLIPNHQPGKPKPKAKVNPTEKWHREAYKLWLQQFKSIGELTDYFTENGELTGLTRIDNMNNMSKIIRRMIDKDPNRNKSFGPTSGKRLEK